MTTEAPFTPPKKKPSIFWWIGGATFLLVTFFVFQLFGPSPAIIVSPQTTCVTSPLRPNGLPDYKKWLLNLYRDGVTPENNAAALIWPAIWPGELNASQYAAVAAELGLTAIPKKSDALAYTIKYMREMVNVEYLQTHSQASDSNASANPNTGDNRLAEISARVDKLIDRIYGRPWTSQEFPRMAKWVHDNQKPLDMLVDASHRSRCYFPSPTLLDNKGDSVVSILLPGQQSAREAARSLVTRAMWNIGEHHNADAWRDLFAIHRLGRLMAQDPLLVEQLIGFAMAGFAHDGTIELLHEGNLTPEEARVVMRDLAARPAFSNAADMLDTTARVFFLETIIEYSRGDIDAHSMDALKSSPSVPFATQIRFANHLSIDWNVVMRTGNEYFDRYAKAARLPTYTARIQAYRKIYDELDQATKPMETPALVATALNPSARNKSVAAVFLKAILPATEAALSAQERANAHQELLQVAAALTVYRADHAHYPDKLEDLTPTILDKLPVDLFTARPFAYKRMDDGYLLYSLGPNGIDDAGNNQNYGLYEGHYLYDYPDPEALRSKIPQSSDDVAIRVPRLPIEVPPLTQH